MPTSRDSLQQALERGFINKDSEATLHYRPQLLLNNNDQQVLPTILQELNTCQEFFISVAFITESGLAMLKTALHELLLKGIKGRIITSTYLNFNKPKIFKELMKLKNVEVRVTDINGFHAKGYYFKHQEHSTFIVGSSNLTGNALKKNYEWNVKLTTLENGELISNFHNQFQDIWNAANILDINWIESYEKYYKEIQIDSKVFKVAETATANPLSEILEIKPNAMQQVALKEIADLRATGAKRGLVISATGTGKTFLSAFEIRAFQPKKLLFVVHREQILKKAMSDYKKIIGGKDEDYGLFTGTSKEVNAKYLFATIQSIAKDSVLNAFDPQEFDYIIIDEVHKAGAASYLRLLNYFEPEFLLGMTATPERTDDVNIYEIFDYNIAYEIRLQAALEEDMLCPFHYFGITDYEVDGELIDDVTDFKYLVSDERVEHVLERVNYYGYSGEKLRGLVFCSSKKEAYELAKLFNEKGYKSRALTGEDNQEIREQAVEELENGTLEYLFTVDIFNEGIDIPMVNQIIMLRQTQSSIIFIQQLGRGLRKHNAKEYVTIIDFIGNYKNNYLIPVALSGDNTLNKDNIRRNTVDMKLIKGISTVNFEEVAKQRIFQSITNTNMSTFTKLREAYFQLKDRIGKQPKLMDFIKHNSIDPLVLTKDVKSYYEFLKKAKEPIPNLSQVESKMLRFLSVEIMNGKRIHELVLTQLLLNQLEVSKEEFIIRLEALGIPIKEETIKSVEKVLDFSFFTELVVKRYGYHPFIVIENDNYKLNLDVLTPEMKQEVEDIINVGFYNAGKYNHHENLTLNEKYSRKDVCRLLNWKSDMSSTVYGYKVENNTCPLFITYHKDDALSTSVHYGDELVTPELLKWYSKPSRYLTSKEIQNIIYAKENEIDVHLFVQKEGSEGTDFYYLGKLIPIIESAQQEIVKDLAGKDVNIVSINFEIKNSVKDSIYQYLKNEVVN